MNVVQLTGSVATDPSFRTTANDHQLLTFSLRYATSRDKKSPNYINCAAWNALAAALAPTLRRRDRVAVTGELRYSAWRAKDGSRRHGTELVLSDARRLPPSPGPSTAGGPR